MDLSAQGNKQKSNAKNMGLPLEGIRIVDVTTWGQALATQMLGDMGAEVIKVEDLSGDPVRGYQAHLTTGLLPDFHMNYVFEVYNRNKKSVGLNLRKPAGREIIHGLVKRSDVFVSNLREKALISWGLDYQSLLQHNDRIIYALGTGLGRKGPDKDLPVMDTVAQARGGLLSIVGEPGSPPPVGGVYSMGDTVGAMQLAAGIVLALFVRERTGIGQEVHSSLLGGQLTLGWLLMNALLVTGKEPQKVSRENVTNPLRCNYQAKDGRWFCLALLQADRHWGTLCKAIGAEHLTNDPRFESSEKRAENTGELISILDKVFGTRERNEWMRVFHDYELLCGPWQTYSETATDPQVLANEYIVPVDHPTFGQLREIGLTIQFSKTPGRVRSCAPELGQHTEQILQEILGYNWDDIGRLKDDGVIT